MIWRSIRRRNLVPFISTAFISLLVIKLSVSGLNFPSLHGTESFSFAEETLPGLTQSRSEIGNLTLPLEFAANQRPGFVSVKLSENQTSRIRGLKLAEMRDSRLDSPTTLTEPDQLFRAVGHDSPFAEALEQPFSHNQVLQELDQFEQAFSETVNFLFSSGSGMTQLDSSNPFETALNTETADTDLTENSPVSETGEVANPAETSENGMNGTDPGESDIPTQTNDDTGIDIFYSSLVITEIEGQKGVYRARLSADGRFHLENGYTIRNPATGLIGVGSSLRVAALNERWMSAFWKADLSSELFRVIHKPLGSLLWIQPLFSSSISHMESSLLYTYIQSLALFDIDNDPEKELVVTISQNPNIAVYDLDAEGFVFQRELAVPFAASSLFQTSDGLGNSFLHVFDRTLTRSITFTADTPGNFFFGEPPSFITSQWIQLDSSFQVNGGPSFLALFYRDRIGLVQVSPNTLSVPVSFSTLRRMPQIFIGDFYTPDVIQMMVAP